MTNQEQINKIMSQEQINEIMGKLLDLPQRPVFYEEDYPYPWKPFKSNGGTGDVPADWLQPSTTVESTPQPAASKLCPFRKQIYFKSGSDVTVLQYAQYLEEEFQPCLREKCAVWNEKMGACTY